MFKLAKNKKITVSLQDSEDGDVYLCYNDIPVKWIGEYDGTVVGIDLDDEQLDELEAVGVHLRRSERAISTQG